MNSWSCQRGMPECAAGLSERRDRKNDVDMMSKLPALLARDRERLRHVRRLHVAELQRHPREVLARSA